MHVAPVHVYVPHTTHVVIPHTTYVRPVAPQAHPHTSTNTLRINRSPSTLPAVQPKHQHPHHVVQPIVVNNQLATAATRCKRQQAGDGCKKKEDEQTGWAKVQHWLQLDKH